MTTFLGVSPSDVCEWDTKLSATYRWGQGSGMGIGSAVPWRRCARPEWLTGRCSSNGQRGAFGVLKVEYSSGVNSTDTRGRS
jgi:hypothetical protein